MYRSFDAAGGRFKFQVLEFEGLVVQAFQMGDHLYVCSESDNKGWRTFTTPDRADITMGISIVGDVGPRKITQNYHWHISSSSLSWKGQWYDKRVTQDDCYLYGKEGYEFDPDTPDRRPYLYAKVVITWQGEQAECDLRFKLPSSGIVVIEGTAGHPVLQVSGSCHGQDYSFTDDFEAPQDRYYDSDEGPLAVLYRHIAHSTVEGGPDALWKAFLDRWVQEPVPMEGLAALYKRKAIKPVLARLEAEAPLDWQFFRWLHGKETDAGRRNNQLLGAMLKEIGMLF